MEEHSFLDEDIVKVSGQRYVLLSIVSPQSNQKAENGKLAIKIRGAFDTKEEADAHIRRLQKVDPNFDVFMADMYKWLMLPPDLERMDDVRYQEEYLNDLISGHKESQLQAKALFEERKRAIMERGLDAVLTKEERLPEPTAADALPAPEDFVPVPKTEEGEGSGSASAK